MPELLAIVGPTASGKTDLALILATQRNAELISVDSRQIYRYLAVGTAKPFGTWMDGRYIVDGIPYHLLDIWEPSSSFTAADFVRQAQKTIAEIHARGKEAIFVGGTGLYLKALSDGLASLPPADAAVRKELLAIAEEKGRPFLHDELRRIDPVSARQIPANNIQRLVRALEVYRLTGKPLSYWHEEHQKSVATRLGAKDALTFRIIGLSTDKEELLNRIRDRCQRMIKGGLLEETSDLLARGYAETCPALSSVGYPEALLRIKGKIDHMTLLETMVTKTRQYAKRQLTWFRGQTSATWMTFEAAKETL